MSELLTSLGIDWKLFIAQLINFSILVYILYKYAYQPVLKILDERTKRIEKGLADADKSSKKLKEIEQKEKEILVKAKKEAKSIVNKAEKQAEKNKIELIKVAEKESEKIIEKAKKVANEQKEKMIMEVKSEIATLVTVAVEKIIDEKIDEDRDMEIIKRVIN